MDSVQGYFLNKKLRWGNLQGLNSLQIIVDTLAYSENVPIRLLNVDRLVNFKKEFPRIFSEKQDILVDILASELSRVDFEKSKIFNKGVIKSEIIDDLANPDKINKILDAFNQLGGLLSKDSELVCSPGDLGYDWWNALATILDHVESHFWVTLMGNPLPAHALWRLQPEWRLYNLLYCFFVMSNNIHLEIEGINISEAKAVNVFGINGLCGYFMDPSVRINILNDEGVVNTVIPIVGPIFDANNRNAHDDFIETFFLFCKSLSASLGKNTDLHIISTKTEMEGALSSRIDYTNKEIELRIKNVKNAFLKLFSLKVNSGIDCDILARSDWEALTSYFAWYARWMHTLEWPCVLKEKSEESSSRHSFYIFKEGTNVVLKVFCGKFDLIYLPDEEDATKYVEDLDLYLNLIESEINAKISNAGDLQVEFAGVLSEQRIDRFPIFFNRMCERRNGAWNRQIWSINNLLLRHGMRSVGLELPDVYQIEEDEITRIVKENRWRRTERMAESLGRFLLKGFGRYICRYLADICRADFSDIYWLHWSESPAQLIHVSGYSAVAEYRAHRADIQSKFTDFVLKPDETENPSSCVAFQGVRSKSQAYRIIATRKEEIYPGKGIEEPYFDCYPDGAEKPKSTLGVPIMINDRVLGVILLGGLASNQFNSSLLSPLFNAAGIIGAGMYQQILQNEARMMMELFLNKSVEKNVGLERSQPMSQLNLICRRLSNIFLCEVAQIWLLDENALSMQNGFDCDESLPRYYRLAGYNWYDWFSDDDRDAKNVHQSKKGNAEEFPARREKMVNAFKHISVGVEAPQTCKDTPFAGLAINLVHNAIEADKQEKCGHESGQVRAQKGKFVQGLYNPNEEGQATYTAYEASANGVALGKTFLDPHMEIDENTDEHLVRRMKIYRKYEFYSIMAFPLVEPAIKYGEFYLPARVIGVVTLHGRPGKNLDQKINIGVDWSNGWQATVAYMQDYLTYLIQHYLGGNKGKIYSLEEGWGGR